MQQRQGRDRRAVLQPALSAPDRASRPSRRARELDPASGPRLSRRVVRFSANDGPAGTRIPYLLVRPERRCSLDRAVSCGSWPSWRSS